MNKLDKATISEIIELHKADIISTDYAMDLLLKKEDRAGNGNYLYKTGQGDNIKQ